jgi:hypothetical protein
MENPEKLAALGTKNKRRRKTKRRTPHIMFWTPIYVSKQE